MDWRHVQIPKKMKALAKDRRGYPIPFIVMRDTDGYPHFTINNSSLQRRCLKEKRCPICGSKLGRERREVNLSQLDQILGINGTFPSHSRSAEFTPSARGRPSLRFAIIRIMSAKF